MAVPLLTSAVIDLTAEDSDEDSATSANTNCSDDDYELKPANINGPRSFRAEQLESFQSSSSTLIASSTVRNVESTGVPSYGRSSFEWKKISAKQATNSSSDEWTNQNYKRINLLDSGADNCVLSDSDKEEDVVSGSLMQGSKPKAAAYSLSASDSDADFDEVPTQSNKRKSKCLEEVNCDSDQDVGWPPKSAAERSSDSENDFDLPSSQQSLKSFHPLSDSEDSSHVPQSFQTKRKDTGRKTKAVVVTKQGKEDNQDEAGASKRKRRRTPAEIAAADAAKAERKRHMEELRRIRPGQCLKYLVMEVDPALLEIPALSAVLLAPPTSELRTTTVERDVPYSVGWYQELMPDPPNVPRSKYSDMMLQLLEMSMVASLVSGGQLSEHVVSILESQTSIKRLTIVVFGSKQYFRDRAGKKKKGTEDITKSQLDQAIVECQIEMGVTFRLLETAQEVSEWLHRYSKAVAEHPFKSSKRGWQDSFRFYLAAEKGRTVRVGAEGQGLPQLWVQVLRKFRRAPLETCQAIAAAFPSPAALIAAYEACGSVEEARDLLQNIKVQRGAGPLLAQRRVGPVLSRKIHAVFTSTQPATLLSEVT